MKRNLKQKIASALIVSMMAGLTVSPAWGAGYANRWVFEGGVWHYYDGDGRMVKGKAKRQGGEWYAFAPDGAMLSDQLYTFEGYHPDIENEEEGEGEGPDSYIFPDGQMARNQWVILRDTGNGDTREEREKRYVYDADVPEDELHWYYFGDDSKDHPGLMKYNEWGAAGKGDDRFAWDADGRMYSETWLYVDDEGEILGTLEDEDDMPEGIQKNTVNLRYFMKEGYMAKDSQILKQDDFWYEFDEEGKVCAIMRVASSSDWDNAVVKSGPGTGVTATDSNAQFKVPKDVVDIEIMDQDVFVTPGKSVTLTFKAIMSTPSNATAESLVNGLRLDDHDFWLSINKSGKADFEVTNKKEGIVEVTYTPKLISEEQVKLFIDGITSDDFVTIRPKLDNVAEVKDAVDDVMKNMGSGDISATTAKKAIEDFIDTATASNVSKKAILNQLAEQSSYDTFAQNYAMENSIGESANVPDEVAQLLKSGSVSIVGGALNAESGQSVQLNVNTSDTVTIPETEGYAVTAAFDLTLDINGTSVSELEYPVKITMPVPEGMKTSSVVLYHIHDDDTTEVKIVDQKADTITFITDSFSTYVFAGEKDNGTGGNGSGGSTGGGSSSGGGGGSSSSSSSTGTTITDPKKGQVNSVTGIITGSGDGYSNWVATTAEDGTVTWQLRYADGTMAAGSIVTREDGTTYEQVAWELINGAWYAFGADSIAKGGMIYDVDLAGYFYVDINSGMVTGWAQIDGQWRYFNPVSDGKRGIMFTDSWIDGWYVNPDGIWDGQAQAQ